VEPAKSLPTFFPGHESGSDHHHTKHGIAAVLVGIGCFVLAWFQSGPKGAGPSRYDELRSDPVEREQDRRPGPTGTGSKRVWGRSRAVIGSAPTRTPARQDAPLAPTHRRISTGRGRRISVAPCRPGCPAPRPAVDRDLVERDRRGLPTAFKRSRG
jgi:hypothetical protein